MCRLLIAVTPLVAERGLQVPGLQQLWLTGSRALGQELWHIGLAVPPDVGSFQTRDQTDVPCTGREFFTTKPPGKPGPGVLKKTVAGPLN